MKIGLISDVHANLPALEAVLDAAPEIDVWIHAGDIVGYGPWPSETISVFQKEGIVSIQGNHDRAAIGDFHDGFVGIPRLMAEWTASQLSDEECQYLESLPVETNYADGQIHVVHGAPDAPNRRLTLDDIEPSLLDGGDVLVLGHTHDQIVREFDAGTVVNPGSVGQPRDGDWRSAFAILSLDTMDVETHRIPYPYERVQETARSYGFPDPIVTAYERGSISSSELASWTEDVDPQDLGLD
ncbi:metallophosphoesterase family protein [Halobellus rufus]|uniref:metallophosphoesterase family protein n=1 Tax=Halobellus rufus TaxID=1448860 RepID=UPI000679290A|nr:metallophosphoesterase family protein [Halobellus rufus]